MRAVRIAIPSALVAVVLGGWWVAEQAEQVRRDTLTGVIETRQISLGSKVAGRVKEARVREGDRVEKNQVLVVFEAEEYVAAEEAQKAAYEEALAKLRLLKAGTRPELIARLQAALNEADAGYRHALKGSRAEEIEKAEAAVLQAEAELKKLLAGNRPEEIAQARSALRAAQAEYEKALEGPREEEINRAKALHNRARAERERAESDLERYLDLFAQNALPRRQLELAETGYRVACESENYAAETLRELLAGTRQQDLEILRARVEQAELALNLAQKGPRREDIDAARQRLRQAKAALALLEAGPRKEEIEALFFRKKQAEAALREAQNGPRHEEIAAATATVDRARAAMKQTSVPKREAVVRAPTSGIVQKMDLRPGDFLPIGREVCVIQPEGDLWVRLYVPESHLRYVRVGKSVTLKVDAYPDESFSGLIEFVSTVAEFTPRNVQTPEERIAQVFAVKIRLKDPERRLRAGMSVQMRLSKLART